MKKIFFIITLITILFFPTNSFCILGIPSTEDILKFLKETVITEKFKGAVGGAAGTVVLDAVLRETLSVKSIQDFL